jgi:hypothetical protein
VSEIHELPYGERMLEAQTELLCESPYMSKSQFRALVTLNNRMPNVLDPLGYTFVSLSFRESDSLPLLIVKVRNDEGTWICFTNGRSFFNCVVIFLRKLAENRIAWRADKFC